MPKSATSGSPPPSRYRFVHRKLALTVDPVPQRFALDEGHHVVQEALRLTRVEEWEDVCVLQVGGRLDLDEKAVYAHDRGQLRLEHFDRHLAVVAHVGGQVYGRHPALAELTLNRVPPLEGGVQTVDWIGHDAQDPVPSHGAARNSDGVVSAFSRQTATADSIRVGVNHWPCSPAGRERSRWPVRWLPPRRQEGDAMKRLVLVSGIFAGGFVTSRILSRRQPAPTTRFSERMRERFKSHMGRMLESMPEDSPPRLVVSTLPRLAEQNDQILALLREQNALMRELGAKPEADWAESASI
jgi:hypothetical protein